MIAKVKFLFSRQRYVGYVLRAMLFELILLTFYVHWDSPHHVTTGRSRCVNEKSMTATITSAPTLMISRLSLGTLIAGKNKSSLRFF